MAKKRKKKKAKKHWFRNLCIFIVIPLAVWSIAFVLWLFWYDIEGIFPQGASQRTRAPRATPRAERLRPSAAARPDEKLLNEDRKRLEDIINKRR
ncbi:MAG TPA: hypothetical protein VE131_02535 [Terriglobales bacterium]|nr:hypothetical protein [Terriglobales bacterium]